MSGFEKDEQAKETEKVQLKQWVETQKPRKEQCHGVQAGESFKKEGGSEQC